MRLAILLDIDGTLLDTFDAILAAMNAALERAGEAPFRAEELRPLVGIPTAVQLEILRDMDRARSEAISEEYYRHFVRIVRKGLRLYEGVPEALARLADRPIGTMTTRRREVARLMLRVGGIDRNFRAIVGGDEVSRPKPEPDLPRFAAKALGVLPEECIVVGDSPVDIRAGRAAGTWTVAATYGYGELHALRDASPHAEITTFAELPRVVAALEERVGRATP